MRCWSPRARASSNGAADWGRSGGRQARYTSTVESPAGGRTTTRCSLPIPVTGCTHSPRPRHIAGLPARKNGTSLPSSAAPRNNSDCESPKFHKALVATRAAAASLDPPPRPAAVGIRLMSRMATPRFAPVRRRNHSTARTTRFVPPDGTSAPQAWSVPAAEAITHSKSVCPPVCSRK